MSNLPPRSRLLRAWLAVKPRSLLQSWICDSEMNGVCFVCRGPTSPEHRSSDHFGPLAPVPGPAEWSTLAFVKGRYAKMGWKESHADASSRGGFLALKEDGDVADFVALTEPEPTEKEGFKKGTVRNVYRVQVVNAPVKAGCNVLTLDLNIFAFNAYAATVGKGHEMKDVVRMTRHGAKGDLDTRYSFGLVRKVKTPELKECKRALKGSSAF